MTKVVLVFLLSILMCSPMAHAAQEVWQDLNAQVAQLVQDQKIREAHKTSEMAVAVAKDLFGDKDPRLAIALRQMADLAVQVDKRADATRSLNEAIVIWQKELGNNHPFLIAIYKRLSSIYIEGGAYEDALRALNQARDAQEKWFGNEPHSALATTYKEMAQVHERQAQWDKALPLYNEALEIEQNIFGAGTQRVANTLRERANILLGLGSFEDARKDQTHVIEINKQLKNQTREELAMDLTLLAETYAKLNNSYEAIRLWTMAVDILDNPTAEPTFKLKALILFRLREHYLSIGDEAQAQATNERALELEKEAQTKLNP